MALKVRRKKPTRTKNKLAVKRKTKKKNRPVTCDIEEPACPCDYFPSGSTRLNLALSGMPDRGWARARCDNLVGDRSAGKTLLALEAGANFYYMLPYLKSKIFPKKKNPMVVYDNGEGVMDFDIERMYGSRFYEALELIRSPHIQAMGNNFITRASTLGKHDALLYIVDTWDFFRSKEQLSRFNKAVKDNADIEASYDGEKQKWAAGFFSKTSELMDKNETDATLLIVSQIRKVMNPRPFQKASYRTGGQAFGHAMHQEAWIREKKKNEATRFGESRVYSIDVGVKVEKNKTAKPYRQAEFTILYDYGIDDITSLVQYVIGKPSNKSKKTWKGQTFTHIKQAVNFIEENDLEKKIRKEAAEKFRKVEKAFEEEVSERKKRWDSPIAG